MESEGENGGFSTCGEGAPLGMVVRQRNWKLDDPHMLSLIFPSGSGQFVDMFFDLIWWKTNTTISRTPKGWLMDTP